MLWAVCGIGRNRLEQMKLGWWVIVKFHSLLLNLVKFLILINLLVLRIHVIVLEFRDLQGFSKSLSSGDWDWDWDFELSSLLLLFFLLFFTARIENLCHHFSFSRLLEFLPRVPHLLRTLGNCNLKQTSTNCLCIQGWLFVKNWSLISVWICELACLLSLRYCFHRT